MRVAAMHRIGARAERLASSTAAWRISGCLAVDDVGGDGQYRLSVHGIAIGRMLSELCHKPFDKVDGDGIDTIVVIAVGRKLSLGLVVHYEPRLVTNSPHLGILDRGKAVGCDR